MRFIEKRKNTPLFLHQWFQDTPVKESGQHYNCKYDPDMPTNIKNKIKEQLLKEQGYLCCYTGIRISKDDDGHDDAHIEHLIPQKYCFNHEDVDYYNMLAAYPKDEVVACPYGAKKRGHWYEPDLFVTPLQPGCEARFRFSLDGKISPSQDDDAAARETIKNLGLDHDELIRWRKKIIDQILFPRNRVLSDTDLNNLIEMYGKRDKDRKYRIFCFVVIQTAQQLVASRQKQRERDAKRNAAIRNQQNQKNRKR